MDAVSSAAAVMMRGGASVLCDLHDLVGLRRRNQMRIGDRQS
jgi:hypothetical protein